MAEGNFAVAVVIVIAHPLRGRRFALTTMEESATASPYLI